MVLSKGLISVIMPVYNGEKFVYQAVNSILNQTYKNFELLIIDDGSNDNSIKIIKSFNDKRIRIFKNPHLGLVKTLNFGLKQTKGAFVARMDADDVSDKKRFEIQVHKILNSDSDICGCSFSTIDYLNNILNKYNVPINKNDIAIRLSHTVPFCHGSLIARREIFDRYKYGNGVNEDVEDYSLWILMFLDDVKFTNCCENLYYQRQHSQTLSKSKGKKKLKFSSNKVSNFYLSKNIHNLKNILEGKNLCNYFLIDNDKSYDYLYVIKKLSNSLFKKNRLKKLILQFILILKYLFYILIRLIGKLQFKNKFCSNKK